MNKRNRENEDDIQPTEMVRKPFKKFTVNKGLLFKYDDKVNKPNIMSMNKEERLYFLANDDNPFGYPQEYWDIYKRERERRNLQGFENLANVTNIKIFNNNIDQLQWKMIIKNHRNINCIKSKEQYNTDVLELIRFNDNAYLIFEELGMVYINSYESFIENKKLNDTKYIIEIEVQTRKFFMELDYYKDVEMKSNILDYYTKTYWEDEYNELLETQNCDIYDCILALLNVALGEYSQFVCVAGGFALSMYIYKNYGYHIGFNDVDLFIHSCNDEYTKDIVDILYNEFDYTCYNDNVISFSIHDSKDKLIYYETIMNNMLKFQIIRRLYSCPQEVIAGFDVDSCCILTTLDRQIYVTERGEYSIKNGYNTLNFERMSPSYEYRLLKYNTRGFAIWIPFMEHFKENAIFCKSIYDKKKGSTIFLKYFGKYFNNDTIFRHTSDYFTTKMERYKINKKLDFKTLNPNEQTINTFHRIFLEDPFEWYPVKPTENYVNLFNLNFLDNVTLVEINNYISLKVLHAKNLISKNRKNYNNYSNSYVSETCFRVLKFIYEVDPNISVFGSIIESVIFGRPSYGFKLEESKIISNDKFRLLLLLFININRYFNKIFKLIGLTFNINTLSDLLKFKFVYKNNNVEEIIDIINIIDDQQLLQPREDMLQCKNITFYPEDHFNIINENNQLDNNELVIIVPNEFLNIHLELIKRNKYLDFKNKYGRKKKSCRHDFISLIQRKDNLINFSEELELYKKSKRLFNKSYNEDYMLKNPIKTYEEYENITNFDIYFDNISMSNIMNISNISTFEADILRKNDFQFTNGKVYGTQYNIAKREYNIDYNLEYPVIENFVC
jgi:hypothetical protein